MTVLCIWLAASPAQGRVLDRVAVTVDERIITLSDVIEEIRLTSLLEGTAVEITPESKRRAAERLVENILISRDMELTRFPLPGDEDLEEFLAAILAARGLDTAAWQAELRRYDFSPQRVREHLRQRLGVLRYIEFRFRPQVQVSDAGVRPLVQDRAPPGTPPPAGSPERALEAARQAAEAALAAQRVDELVDAWLKEARRRARIRYKEAAFQ